MKILLMILLLVPQVALARVYMCVDPETGKKSFTDKACEQAGPGEKVRVNVANPGAHARRPKKNPNKVWQSQLDNTRSGRDYNQEREGLQESRAVGVAANGG